MPIITTLVIGRRPVSFSRPISRDARQIWPTISETFRLRLKPCWAVEQNLHSNAQPTCEDTHRVARSPSGMYTVSTSWSPTLIAHLIVPSEECWASETTGATISQRRWSFSRNFLLMLFIFSKSSTPKWYIHFITWSARKAFSFNSSVKNLRRPLRSKSSRLTLAVVMMPLNDGTIIKGANCTAFTHVQQGL